MSASQFWLVSIRNTQANRSDLIAYISPYNEAIQHNPLPNMWNIDDVTGLIALEGEIERQANLMAYTNDFSVTDVHHFSLPTFSFSNASI